MKRKEIRFLALIMSFFMVFGLINIPVGSIAKVNAEGNSGDAFELVSEYDSYSFDYSEQFYDDGPNALILVKVYPQLTDDYDVYTDGITGGMMWSIDSIYDDDAGFTGVILRGETQFSDRTKDNYLNVDIVKSGTTPENGSFGHINVPVELTDSSSENKNTVTINVDFNGGKIVYNSETTSDLEGFTSEIEVGSCLKDITYVDNGWVKEGFPTLEKSGYIHVGYRTQDGKLLAFDRNDSDYLFLNYYPDEDMTLTAEWEEAVEFTFDYNGGHYFQSINKTSEIWNVRKGKITKMYIDDPVLEGKAFAGWKCNIDDQIYDSNDIYFSFKSDVSVKFTAVWEEAVEFTFDYNGGHDYDFENITSAKRYARKGEITYIRLGDPVLEGKVFVGWKCNIDDQIRSSDDIRYDFKSDVPVEFTAVWADPVEFTFDYNEGHDPYDNNKISAEWTVGKGFAAKSYINDPVIEENKAFSGWKASTDGNIYSSYEVGYEFTSNEDVTFTAQWEEASTITLRTDVGSFYNGDDEYKIKIKKGEAIKTWIEPKLEGYTLSHWVDEESGECYLTSDLVSIVPDKDRTFVAVMGETVYYTFDANGGYFYGNTSRSTYDIKKAKGQSVGTFDDPEHPDGLVVSGWKCEADGKIYSKEEICNDFKAYEDVVFYAQWDEECTVTFDANGGWMSTKWNSKAGKEVPDYLTSLYWMPKGSKIGDNWKIPYNDDKYEFAGYKIKGSDILYVTENKGDYELKTGEAFLSDYSLTGDVTFYAEWIYAEDWRESDDKYAITFDGNGGYMSEKWCNDWWVESYLPDERTTTRYIEKGNKINSNIAPIERFGYIFTGYKLENSDILYVIGDGEYELNDNEELLSEYVPTGNVTFYAQWIDDESVDAVNVTMDPGEGYILDEDTGRTGYGIHDLSDFDYSYHFGKYKKGDTFSFSLTARKEGMVFDGWKSSMNESVANGFYISDINEDITFTAQYSEGVVVVLDLNGGYYTEPSYMSSNYYFKFNPWIVASDEGKIDIDNLIFISNEEGKALYGWKKEGDDKLYSTQDLKGMVFDEDVIFTAQWSDGYKVSLYYDFHDVPYHGDEEYQINVARNQMISCRFPDVGYGYYIEYWTLDGDDKEYQTEDILNMVVDRDLYFTAHCKEKTAINATLNGNGGIVYYGPLAVEEYKGEYFVQPGEKHTIGKVSAKKQGYKLVGWLVEDDSLLSGTIIDDITNYEFSGDVTFTAQWCEAVDVTFDANGGSFYEKDSDVTTINKTLCKGDTIGEIDAEPISNDDSYEFAGWYIEGDEDTIYSTESLSENYVVNEDVTFKAAWKEKGENDEDCVITFDLNGGYLWFPGGNTTYENQIVVAKKNQYNNIFVNTPAPVVEGTGGPGPDIEFRAWKNTSTGEMVSPLDLHNYYVEDDTTFIAVFEPMVDVWIDFDSGYIARGMDGSKSESARAKVFSGESLSRVFWYINGSTEFSGKWKVSINGQLVPIENDYDAKLLGWEVDGEYYPNDKLDECIITEEVSVKAVWDKEIYNCSKKGHNWDEGIVTKQPTCTEKGVKEFTCTICGKKRTVDIAAKGHTVVKDDAVAATTETTGLTEGSHCSVCKAIIKRQEIVPKKEDPNKKAEEEAKKKAEEEAKRKAEEEAKKKAEEEAKKKAEENAKTSYSNEWVDGKWYDQNGKQNYSGTLLWKSDAIGWWVEDTDGWYPKNSWQKIDGTWYYFKPDGYMAMDEYYNGYWFNKDGSWDPTYKLSWKSDATGWWVEDISGWWPSNVWLKIDGCWYYFDGSGYMVTNQYVSGWWIGADGVCR